MAWPTEHPLAELRREFRTLYDRLFAGCPTLFEEFMPERLWNLEVEEMEKELVVRMAVPGFETEEFNLEMRGNRLFVKAEHPAEAKEVKEPTEAKEKVVRRFERVLEMPEGLDPEKVTALYRNGVLEVHLPRLEATLPRRIPVTADVAK